MRDKEREEALSLEQQRPVHLPVSDEVYLLQNFRWLILANQANINYRSDLHMDSHFHCYMNTFDYEESLFRIDSNLQELRDQKERYIQFNKRNEGNPLTARLELDGPLLCALFPPLWRRQTRSCPPKRREERTSPREASRNVRKH